MLKESEPDGAYITLFRRASELAWKDASPEIHEECTLEVEEEKKEKEQLKALDEEDEAGERTPEQYARYVEFLDYTLL